MTVRAEVDWTLIDNAAKALGIGYESRKQWRRTRHVPHKWRFEIIKHLGGTISMDAFDGGTREAAE